VSWPCGRRATAAGSPRAAGRNLWDSLPTCRRITRQGPLRRGVPAASRRSETPVARRTSHDRRPWSPGGQGQQRELWRGKARGVKHLRTDVLDFVVPPIVAAVIFGQHHVGNAARECSPETHSKTCRLLMTGALITQLNMWRRGGAPLRRGMHFQLGTHYLVF
jgi:hypothetical protein